MSQINNEINGIYQGFSFERAQFQKEACQALKAEENLLVLVPTGSGKTVVAIDGIAKHLEDDGHIIYTSPIKALSNQVYYDLCEIFGNETVGLVTGDNRINTAAKILVMTTEILRNSMFRQNSDEKEVSVEIYQWTFNPENISLIIFDEVHYINDKSRGHVWNDCIQKVPKETQLIMLSATFNPSETFIEWVKQKGRNLRIIKLDNRPVPLEYYLYQNDDYESFCIQNKWNNNVWTDTVKTAKVRRIHINQVTQCVKSLQEKDWLPATIFILSKSTIDNWANKIPYHFLEKEELKELNQIWNQKLKTYKEEYNKNSSYWNMIYQLTQKGIGIHHSGIPTILKEMIQILYVKKLIKVLLATETFAVGINAPTRTVVFTNLQKYSMNGFRPFNFAEFSQMAGRAGRRGIDTKGRVLLMAYQEMPTEAEAKRMIVSKPTKQTSTEVYCNFNYILEVLNEYANLSETELDPRKYLVQQINKSLSFQDKNIKISQLNQQLEIISKSIENYQLDEKLKPQWEELKKLEQQIATSSKKKKKNAMRLKNNLINTIGRKDMPKIKNLEDKIVQKNKLIQQIQSEKEELDNNLDHIIKFMVTENLIDDELNLTPWGVIVKDIHDCNPLILGRLILDGDIKSLEFPELISLLSLFVADKSVKEEVLLSELKMSEDLNQIIMKIYQKRNEYYKKEAELNHFISNKIYNDWEIHLSLLEPVYHWANGDPWSKVIESYKSEFEGNLIQNILRIINIIRNIELIARLTKNTELLDKIDGYQEKMIRGMVVPESLFIH